MRLFIRNLQVLLAAAFMLASLAACSAYSPQRLERDESHWYPFHFRIDGNVYRILVPPGGMVIREPVTSIATAAVDDYIIAASFGYDYGAGTYNETAQVKIKVSVSRLDDTIDCENFQASFGECISRDLNSVHSDKVEDYDSLGSFRWFHEYGKILPWDNYSVFVARRHYLTIAGFYSDELAARPDRLADRRKLLERIVATVEKLDRQ